MSIIYEALKKTDVQNSKFSEQAVSAKSIKQPLTFVMAAIGIAGAIVIAGYLDKFAVIKSNKPAKQLVKVQALPAPVMPVASLAPEAAVNKLPAAKAVESKPSLPDNLVLSGILVSEDENLALIDDKILRIGDTVDGATIVDILPDRVEISYQNQKFTLKN